MHIKLQQLEVFKAVMETGSISAAAARLNRTQPAISIALANFESEARLTLFDRSKGRFSPTPQAESLYEEVYSGLLGIGRIASVARELREGGQGHLRIAADGAPSIHLLPKVIASFVKENQDVRIDLHTRNSREILAWISGRQIDLGIVEMPVHWPGVAYEPFSQACVCIMPQDHPLTSRSVISPKDLDGEPMVAILENHPINAQLEEAFSTAGCQFNARISGYYFATCRNLVSQGAGLAIVDAMNADDSLGDGIVSRPFEPTIRYDMALVFPAKPSPSALVPAFVETLRNALKPYLLG